MRILIAAAALLSAAGIGAQDAGQKEQPPSLDNTRWSITATPTAEKADSKVVDALLFGSGTVTSTMQMQKGFPASAYTLTQKDGKWLFAARQASAKAGEVTWSCAIAADKLTGTLVCRNKAGAVESFQLRGIRAPALEATSWRITVSDTSEEAKPAKPREDTLLFVAHKMTSKEARSKGFLMCPFSLVPNEEGVWVFGAVQRSAKEKTRMVWTGEVKGNTMRGTVTMIDPAGEVASESEFEGSKTDKPVRIKKRDGKKKKSKRKGKKGKKG